MMVYMRKALLYILVSFISLFVVLIIFSIIRSYEHTTNLTNEGLYVSYYYPELPNNELSNEALSIDRDCKNLKDVDLSCGGFFSCTHKTASNRIRNKAASWGATDVVIFHLSLREKSVHMLGSAYSCKH